MEYAIGRGMEIMRLSPEQQIKIRVMESNRGRGFMPFEIQGIFNMPSLKQTYLMPEIDAAQSSHKQRIKNEFFTKKLFPTYFHLSPIDVEACHQFDHAIISEGVDFVYSGAKENKKRLRDEVSTGDWGE